MKYTTIKTLTIELTLDSSEAIMFMKGGLHKVIIPKVGYDHDDKELPDIRDCDNITITVQIDKNQQPRFDWLKGEAQSNKEQNQKDNQEKPV